MIGGKVEKVYHLGDCRAVLVRGSGSEYNDWRVVDVVLDAPTMERGDNIWWQSNLVLWTPQDNSRQDVHITRVGTSYDRKTLWAKIKERCEQGLCPECGSDQTMFDRRGSLWCAACDASYRA